MSRPMSPVDVYNLALDHLKESPIASEDSDTKAAKLCARWGDHTRRVALRKHSWNFATKRAVLAALTDAPTFEYTRAFQLPNDFVRLVSIGEYGELKEFQLENSQILTMDAQAPLPMKYIYDFKDVGKMDALFVEVWAMELAAKISYALTGSSERGRVLTQEIVDILAPQAYAVDGQERPPDRIERSKYRNAQQINRGGRRRDVRYIDGE